MNKFFSKYIRRSFNQDLMKIKFHEDLKILVIGGAGTIGSNYIKQILNLKPSKIVVADTNENGLTELTRDLRSSNLLDYKPEYITYPINLMSETFDKILYDFVLQVLRVFLNKRQAKPMHH